MIVSVSRLGARRFFPNFLWMFAVLIYCLASPGLALSAEAETPEAETPGAEAPEAETIVESSFRYMRGDASESRVRMTIHRPDWERTMLLRVWTRGETESLIRIEEPARDAGNGTLKVGTEMWMYNPKVNRVIKVPPSMMSQSWMGSDFSNNDLARSDNLLRDYDHELAGSETRDGMTAYRIVSTPRPAAPVVWGKQEMVIREDHILLEQIFFDEDMAEVKRMTTGDIAERSGRLFPGTMRMEKADAPEEYTQMEYLEIEFLETLPDRYFTRSALQTPRR